ncbi:MAG: hypothetical protein K0M63_01265 [Weeksellaceae bacterium]|nr:hypothetical protein [Weeksellaceae bacterium]
MKKLLTVLCAVAGIFVLAQNDMNFTPQKALEDQWYRTVFNENIADVQGSPYHESKFIPARLEGTQEFISARYNVYHDNLEFNKDGKIMVVPKSDTYKSFRFTLSNEKIELINDGYYFHIYEGKKHQAYKKEKLKFQKFQKATSGYVDDTPAKFLNLPDTYFLLINNQLVEIPKNQKTFANLFPDKKDEIIKFMKDNKTKLNSENDIKKVLKFIDQ